MKVFRILVLCFLAVILIYFFQGEIRGLVSKIKNKGDFREPIDLRTSILALEKNIKESAKNWDKKSISINNEPLLRDKSQTDGVLSVTGVLSNTNDERKKEGLEALTLNTKLSLAAEAKMNDMFTKGYFAHESPEGVGPSDLAVKAGYDYLSVGENLALGFFSSDEDLVTAWMNSPGHRANILGKNYKEIGLAVKKAMYQGKIQWIAVQEFGTPSTLCSRPSMIVKEDINKENQNIEKIKESIDSLKSEIDRRKNSDEEYNSLVDAYNKLVNEYNSKVLEVKKEIQEYNDSINNFNDCLAKYTS